MSDLDKKRGRYLECALSLPILEAGHRVAALDAPTEDKSSLLEIALREHVSELDAATKTKLTVARVWLNPPRSAERMIRWAVDNPHHFYDHRIMHAGALLATYPFIGSVFTVLGRAFALGSSTFAVDVRNRSVDLWGGSTAVVHGTSKAITSLKRLDLITGGGRSPIVAGPPMEVESHAASWLIHSALLTRDQEAIDTYEALDTPELFWANLVDPSADYPFLEKHQEGLNRTVWVIR